MSSFANGFLFEDLGNLETSAEVAGTSVTLSNGAFLLSVEPVRSFV